MIWFHSSCMKPSPTPCTWVEVVKCVKIFQPMKISTLGQTTKRHNIRYIVCPWAVSDLRAFRKRVKMLGGMRKWFVVGRQIIAPFGKMFAVLHVCCLQQAAASAAHQKKRVQIDWHNGWWMKFPARQIGVKNSPRKCATRYGIVGRWMRNVMVSFEIWVASLKSSLWNNGAKWMLCLRIVIFRYMQFGGKGTGIINW